MIGVDIVDLQEAGRSPHWDTDRYRAKVFTHLEIEYILKSTDKLRTSSRLWSMKEAAYKIYNRKENIKELAPRKLACTFLNDKKGTVCIGPYQFYTISDDKDGCIYSVCLEDSKLDYEIVLVDISEVPISLHSQYIINSYKRNEVQKLGAENSISHHGRKGAIAHARGPID